VSTYYGPTWPTAAESARATWRTAEVNADPRSTMAEREAAAWAEAAAITARRHQPETEGVRADLEAGA
jgi:hypothetical protein